MDKEELKKLNWLRAGVLGANDGIVSVAAIIVGVAAASSQLTDNTTTILLAALAGLFAGALSMSAGEYVSVSAQRDAELKSHDKNNIDNGHLTNPWHAAIASFIAFAIGGSLPLIVGVLTPAHWTIIATFTSVIFALTLTGYVSALFVETSKRKSILRNVLGGTFSMIVTYLLGVAADSWIL